MRHTLETLIRYCVEQGLIEAPLAVRNYLLRDSTDESGLEVLKAYEDAGVAGPRFYTRVIDAQ